MSKVLYMKGMNTSETESEDGDEDIWDDRKLNDAYDKALKMANVEVAKRVAMSTNTENKDKGGSKLRKEKKHGSHKKEKKDEINWKAGMPCRALYEGDGLEYEAFVLRVINDREVIVRFLGYENSEIVPIHTVKPSLGKNERAKQIEQAIKDEEANEYENPLPKVVNMDLGSESSAGSHRTKSTGKKRNSLKHNKMPNDFILPNLPQPQPNISMFVKGEPSDLPLPPPPLTMPFDSVHSEDQAISSMLISWYMSGYYTGLYQGMKKTKESSKK